MKKGIILTLGMSYEPLVYSVKELQCNYVVFLGTESSINNTLDITVEQASLKPSQIKKLQIDEYDVNVSQIFDLIAESIEWFKIKGVTQIICDPTGGRKWMSAGAIMASSFYGLSLIYVDAKYEGGKIDKSSMRLIDLDNAYEKTGILWMDKAQEAFNNHNFELCVDYLDQIKKLPPTKKLLIQCIRIISECLARWDRFDHKKTSVSSELNSAITELEDIIKYLPDGKYLSQFVEDLKYLSYNIQKSEIGSGADIYFILDLLANAKRCIERSRYDDAVSRLYRSLEAIGQYRLSKYNIDPSAPDFSLLDEKQIEIFKTGCINGEIPDKLDLKRCYWLLKVIEDNLGIQMFEPTGEFKFFKAEKMLGLRNNSILAHGFNPVSKEKAKKFYSCVLSLVKASFQEESFDEINFYNVPLLKSLVMR